MVNYIHHMENTLVRFKDDQRITPWHISLYLALFQIWNNVRFKEEINIRREELMNLSKIGSANTYTRCLKQLNDWNYIKYIPSKSRFVSSKVHMYRFDTTPDTTCDTTPDTTCDNTPDNSSDTSSDNTSVHLVRPFLNNTKHKENNSKQYKTSKDELHSSSSPPSQSSKNKSTKKKKRFIPPKLEETKAFFQEQKSTTQNAEMFQNHFESNGWLVGGKTKMKDWKAAARNWILRSKNFAGQNANSKTDRLNVNQNKDYGEPL